MPRVVSYTPPWLSRPSPGFEYFHPDKTNKFVNGANASTASPCANRTFAVRGTEIFVAIGNEIRWSELLLLKDLSEVKIKREPGLDNSDEDEMPDREEDPTGQTAYRVLKVPVSREIKQLIMSPFGDYLAILTSHTIHVAVLPNATHLTDHDGSPIKPKTFQLGPTAHVIERAPLATALWHPLGVSGSCLVTVTVDAVVRVWELDRGNRWSFDNPALAIDLRKLIDCVSTSDDYSPAKYGTNKGFSPDTLEMEVAAACFGGKDYEGENSWAPMTLWVAMKEGDIYALCPLLPSKWQPSQSLIPNLSTSIVEKVDGGEGLSEDAEQANEQQYRWIAEIDTQVPIAQNDSFLTSSVYRRPQHPGPTPRLQGPYLPEPYPEETFEITDILCIPAAVDRSDAQTEDGDVNDAQPQGLSVNVLCVGTNDGKVHICLDTDGVEGKWLSSKPRRPQILEEEPLSLLLIETVDLGPPAETAHNSFLTFTSDILSRDSFFVTHSVGVSHISLDPWTQQLENELSSSADNGIEFRLDTIIDNIQSAVEQPILIPRANQALSESASKPLPTAIALEDSDLGYVLLSANSANDPQLVTLESFQEIPEFALPSYEEAPSAFLTSVDPRPTYQPASEFWADSTLGVLMDRYMQSRGRRSLGEPLRMSAATLELMMEAHRVLTHETFQLGVAAAELFRRCERLREELREQVRRVEGVAQRVDAVAGDDADMDASDSEQDDSETPALRAVRRLDDCRLRQGDLVVRYATLRRRLSQASGKALSKKEEDWVREISTLQRSVLAEDEEPDTDSETNTVHARFQEVQRLAQELLSTSKELSKSSADADTGSAAANDNDEGIQAPAEMKRAMSAQIGALLERESALVDATRSKLERLNVVV